VIFAMGDQQAAINSRMHRNTTLPLDADEQAERPGDIIDAEFTEVPYQSDARPECLEKLSDRKYK
jgi:hypothetical protein